MSYLEDLFSLNGKVAVVTGASRGLGKAMAEAVCRAGATTVLVATNKTLLQETQQRLVDDGLDAHVITADLSDPEAGNRLIDQVAEDHARIDVLANCAGVTMQGHALDYTDDDWNKTLQVNLAAPLQLTRRAGAIMKEQGTGGSIINITSIAAERGAANNPAYGASKGGLKMMTKCLAEDLSPFGIRVNNLGPGYFRTDMSTFSWNDPERRKQRSASTMLGRWGMPEDLAGLTVLLASDAGSYITAQDFYVDGGWLAKL
jgi:2-deoxy-D-gluconate 3-dehydrogenase